MNSTDTNQASEDKLKQRFATLFYDDNYEFMLSKPDLFDVGAIDEAVELIRTEKLKLLAEVRERVIGESQPDIGDSSHERNILRLEQRELLTKLEAEL